jgi:hypothetical protein
VVSAIDIVRAKRSIFSSSHRDIGPPPARKCCKLFSANRRSRCEHRFYRTTVSNADFWTTRRESSSHLGAGS